jgi:hypothetical protein
VGNRLARRGDRGSGSAPPSTHVDRPVYNRIALIDMIAKIIPDLARGTRAY